MATSLLVLAAFVVLAASSSAALPVSGSFTGTATFSPGATNGWACDNFKKPAEGLPHVAVNPQQFGFGAACGACIKVTGTGKGQGGEPFEGTYTVTVANILTQGTDGDLDFPMKKFDGQWGINWSFIECPDSTDRISTSRRMLQLP